MKKVHSHKDNLVVANKMASLGDVFKEKERTNWLKAWLALDIAKPGLENFVTNEAQNFHQHIYFKLTGRSCTSCSTENLLKKKKCPRNICDNVRQEIIKEHRYNYQPNCWSSKNTSAHLWQSSSRGYCELAKCFIQTDGYADKTTFKEIDFNGVVSYMLNCKRFDSKLSFPITTGKPTTHTPACLLYKAREIHKAVRHSADMKLSDRDLQDYFKTLKELLRDPGKILSPSLSHDSHAQNAVKKLEELEKDTLLLTTAEMMCLLEAVDATLKQHLKDTVNTSVNELRENTELCIEKINDYMVTCKGELAKEAELHKQDFDKNAKKSMKDYNELTVLGKRDFDGNAVKRTQAFDHNSEKRTQEYDEHTVTRTQAFEENAEKRTQEYDEHTVSRTQAFEENAEKRTQEYDEHTVSRTQAFEENAEKRTQEYDELTVSRKKDFDDNADKRTQDFDEIAEKRLRDINEQCGNTTFTETSYKQSSKELLRAMMNYYAQTLSHVTTSPLNNWVQARLDDIYMPPDLKLMKKDNGSFMKTGVQITKYKNVFSTDGEQSRHTFIQGEAGSGKSTFLAKLVLDWCSANTTKSVEPLPPALTTSADGDSSRRRTKLFKDLKTLTSYKFIFHVTLRDLVQEFEILEMIKQKIIDSIYSKKDRANAYNLLNEIMKRERCLVLLDGLDEWTGTGDHNLPILAVFLSQCDMLITTRPWKMTQSYILDSKIDTLLQLEGVKEPFVVSKRLLACRVEYMESKALDNKQSEFESYVFKNDLVELLVSPMLLSLIVQSWADGTEVKGSRCEIYSLFLESLLKKANSAPSEFQAPPFRCFTGTQYIKPNIEHVDRLAEAAFYLLFSAKRENSLIFSISELMDSNTKLHEKERLDFTLKSGILSATRKRSVSRSSLAFSFIHKSMQEFLAAYHIARITHLNLNDVISRYLDRHEDACLDVSQVFIFLCGLDIMSANKLSGMMDERNNAVIKQSRFSLSKLCKIILQGYREAVANEQTNIALTLSNMYVNLRDSSTELNSLQDVRDLHSIFKNNTRNLLSFYIDVSDIDFDSDDSDDDIAVRGGSPATAEPTSHFVFDMSSCHRLEYLVLRGIWLKVSDSAARSEQPVWSSGVWIVLDSSNPVLPSIKRISLFDITCSSTWLNSLFSTLLTLDHDVKVNISHIEDDLEHINASITTDVNKCLDLTELDPGEVLDAEIVEVLLKSVQLETLNIKLDYSEHIDPNLWDALNSLTINRVTLSVDSVWYGLIVNNESMLSQALLPNNTETICIYLNAQPCLMDAMHGLPIKSLNLYGSGEGLDINHVASLQKLLFSLKQLEKISLLQSNESPGLWEALHNLNIKSLSLNYRDVHNLSSFAQFLASLTHLETLNIRVKYGSHLGLCDALHGLNIKSLSLNDSMGNRQLTFTKPWSRLFQSLTQLETLSIGITDWSKVEASAFFQAFHGLNIKSLSLYGCMFCGINECTSRHWSQLFQSLIQLETLSMRVDACWIFWDYLPEALRGLHITRLSLSGMEKSYKVQNAELLSQSISSLTLLETLTLHVFAYIDLQLPQSLKYFNFYCPGISPPELRDLVKALSVCTQTVESKLEFGCARYKDNWSQATLFPPEEYIPVQLELTVQRNITVKRFRILDRIRADRWYESADSAWSVRDNVAVENDDYDDGIVDDDTYNLFLRHLDSRYNAFVGDLESDIKNRISMRVQSHAASNS